MCGIAGIFAYHHEALPVNRDELIRIRERMITRGPDGKGLWLSSNYRVGLAHRRLAILDLSEAGAQPMVDPDTGNSIVFNGEIYNYPALKTDLEAAGHTFRSHTDTEVLLKLYAIHGQDMLHKLRGMYAFAIWDARAKSVTLARDPLGIKPLYYSDNGKTIRFASQVKALLKGGAIDTTPEPAGHVGFFVWGSVPEPYTLYKYIRALPAGHWMRISHSGATAPVCFDSVAKRLAIASQNPLSMVDSEALAYIAEATKASIRAHLLADVPVGVFLSSGLDSAMLAATAAQSGEVRTITLGFDEYRGTTDDETLLAEELARQLSARHSTIRITAADFHSECANLLDAMDQPSIDGVNTWFVAKAAASRGLKVALSGLGGDELFATYPSFEQVPRMHRKLAGLAGVPGIGKAFRIVSAPLLKRFTSSKYASLLEYGGSVGGAYLLRRGLYMPWELPEIMDPDMARIGWRELNTFSTLACVTEGMSSNRLAVSALEMTCYMKNQLLRDADWAGMAHSLEIRVPLADMELISKTAAVFAASPHLHKRQVAEAVASQLPAVFLQRGKTGFSTPVRDWHEKAEDSGLKGLRGWARSVHHDLFGGEGGIKVLFLTTDSFGGHGGIALYNRDIVMALAEMPEIEEIVVLTRNIPFSPEAIPEKVRFLAQAADSKRRYVYTAFGEVWGDYDLVICGHINLLPLATMLNLVIRAHLVLMVYGIDVWQEPYRFARQWLRRVDAIWSISATTRDRMNAWSCLPEKKYTLLPNAIHLERYGMAEKSPELLDRYDLRGRKIIMTLARLPSAERYKGVDEVLEIMPLLLKAEPTLKYIVVGDGEDRPRLEKKAKSLGVADKVIFTGLVKESEKANFFRLADAFVMPGRGEGFGFVFLEALACGIPVVGSKIDGSREALRDGMLGELVDPRDLATIKQGILHALAQPKRIPEGLSYFAWPAFAERVVVAVRQEIHSKRHTIRSING